MDLHNYEGAMIKTTNGVAVAGITLPTWWPSLEATSNVAAQMVPILSALWLFVQIARMVSKWWAEAGEDGAIGPRVMGGAVGIGGALALAVAVIGQFEGVEMRAYRDVVGVPTICYGETLGVRMGDTATRPECDAMLAKRVAQFAVAIAPCLPPGLPDKTAAAFLSAAYNIGSGGFCRSSMSRRALAGDLRGACDALLLWDKGRINGVLQRIRGLTKRRHAERDLCLSGL